MNRRAPQAGFTLLEVIVVVLVFGVMSAMAYGGLNSVLKMRSRVEESMARTAEFQKAYMRLRNDIQNLVLRPVRDNFGTEQPALMGAREGILQLTRGGWRNPLYLPRGTQERVVYALVEGHLERASYRVLDRAQDSEPVRLNLLDKVDEFRLRYMDKNREWVEQWPAQIQSGQANPDEPPPLAVEMVLVTKDLGEIRLLFKPGSEPAPASLTAPVAPGSGDDKTPPNVPNSDPEPPGSE